MKRLVLYIFLLLGACSISASEEWRNYYKILGISPMASLQDIKKQYENIDKIKLSIPQKQLLASAFYIIGNRTRRETYDQEMQDFKIAQEILGVQVGDSDTDIKNNCEKLKKDFKEGKSKFTEKQIKQACEVAQKMTRPIYGRHMKKRYMDYLIEQELEGFEFINP